MHRRYIIVALIVIGALLGATLFLLMERGPAIPKPPAAPSEVVSVWNSPPSSYALPPILVGEVTLQPFGNERYRQYTPTFALYEGEWIDVITSCNKQFVNYNIEEPWETSFQIVCVTTNYTAVWDRALLDSVFAPFYGKVLYENEVTSKETDRIFTTAVRLFAWEGQGDYYLEFINFHPHEEVHISYEVSKLDITPGWGEGFEEAKLQPWLNSLYDLLVRNKITQAEYEAAENQWLEQFK